MKYICWSIFFMSLVPQTVDAMLFARKKKQTGQNPILVASKKEVFGTSRETNFDKETEKKLKKMKKKDPEKYEYLVNVSTPRGTQKTSSK